jgi:hypothetical protein
MVVRDIIESPLSCCPGMVQPLIRSSISAVVTACFALSAITWGTMPGCVVAANQPPSHAAHGHGESHQPPDQPGKLPGAVHCVVHLCCIQLTTPAAANVAPARLSTPDRTAGLLPAVVFVLVRPSHTLPFAHAPPHTPA